VEISSDLLFFSSNLMEIFSDLIEIFSDSLVFSSDLVGFCPFLSFRRNLFAVFPFYKVAKSFLLNDKSGDLVG
jgi:hypothetical protein